MLAIGKYTNSYRFHMGLEYHGYSYRFTPWDEDCDETCYDPDGRKCYHSLLEALTDILEIAEYLKNNPTAHDAEDALDFLSALCMGTLGVEKHIHEKRISKKPADSCLMDSDDIPF